MTDEERDSFAVYWLGKYGFPLHELECHCSPWAIAEFRAAEAVREVAEAFGDRVIGSLLDAEDSLWDNLPGCSESVERRLDDLLLGRYRKTAKKKPDESAEAFYARIEQLIQDRKNSPPSTGDSEESRYSDERSRDLIQLFRHAQEQVRDFRIEFRETMNSIDDLIRADDAYFQAPGVVEGATKRTDISFGRAINELLVEPIHGAGPKTKVNWGDVRSALEWLGHDLSEFDQKDLQDIHRKFFEAERLRITGERRKPRSEPTVLLSHFA